MLWQLGLISMASKAQKQDRDVIVQGQRVRPTEGNTHEQPYRGKRARGDYQAGDRLHTFDRQPAHPPMRSAAFSGKGFLPDLHAGHAPTTLYEASATTLENEGVHGREGMMPVAGNLGRLQAGQRPDEGSGGCGSFVTVPAFGGRNNG